TDTHRAETRSHGPRPRGNPSNLPGSPTLSRRPNKIFLTDDRFTRPPRHDTPTGTRPAEDRFVGDALRAGHLEVSSIPSGLGTPQYLGAPQAANRFSESLPPGAVRLSASRIPSGHERD